MIEAVVTLRGGKPVDMVCLEGRDPVPFVLGLASSVQGTAELGVCQVRVGPVECPDAPRMFNAQLKASGGLLFGSANSNVQTSCRVRPHAMTSYNGDFYSPGELRAIDLIRYRENVAGYPGADRVLSWFYKDAHVFRPVHAKDDLERIETILYRIHLTTVDGSRSKRVDFGWILTDSTGKVLRRLVIEGRMMSRKEKILDFAEYVLSRAHDNYRPLIKLLDGRVVEMAPSVSRYSELSLAA